MKIIGRYVDTNNFFQGDRKTKVTLKETFWIKFTDFYCIAT